MRLEPPLPPTPSPIPSAVRHGVGLGVGKSRERPVQGRVNASRSGERGSTSRPSGFAPGRSAHRAPSPVQGRASRRAIARLRQGRSGPRASSEHKGTQFPFRELRDANNACGSGGQGVTRNASFLSLLGQAVPAQHKTRCALSAKRY